MADLKARTAKMVFTKKGHVPVMDLGRHANRKVLVDVNYFNNMVYSIPKSVVLTGVFVHDTEEYWPIRFDYDGDIQALLMGIKDEN